MACPYSKTVDGFESQFGVNHLAHFLLTTSLIPELKAGKPSRVVVVSSVANKRAGINWDDINWEKNYDKWLAYSQSKTANILFAINNSINYMHQKVFKHILYIQVEF
jgi:NAD(P)-dependent dehydrogenase (short-subunit alcohol dehydrogenase family)